MWICKTCKGHNRHEDRCPQLDHDVCVCCGRRGEHATRCPFVTGDVDAIAEHTGMAPSEAATRFGLVR